MHVCKFMCTMSACIYGDQKWKLDYLKVVDLEEILSCPMWVLGILSKSSKHS